MIPEDCRLDIYVDETLLQRVAQVERVLTGFADLGHLQILETGYALKYQNIMATAPPELVKALEAKLNDLEGVYVNRQPPEVEADLP